MPNLSDASGVETLLVNCWVQGDKYGIVAYQDEAMIQLLHIYREKVPQHEVIELALAKSAPGSKLRKLMAEELAHQFGSDGPEPQVLAGTVPGKTSSVQSAFRRQEGVRERIL